VSRRVLVFLLIALVLGAVDAHATSSRIVALGEGSAFYEDDRNVMRWYGSLADYPNIVAVESGHFTFDKGYQGRNGRKLSGPGIGGHLQVDDEGTWGTIAVVYHARGDDADPGSLHRGFLGSHMSLMWGKKLDVITIGLLWRNAGETRTTGATASTIRGRQEVGFGFRYDLGERAYLDISGETRRLTDRAEGTTGGGEPWATPGYDSWDNYGFRARVFWGISERLVLVPLIENISEDFTGTFFADGGLVQETSDNKGHLWRFGAGLNFLRDPDNMMVLSADFIDARMAHGVHGIDLEPAGIFMERYRAFLGKVALESRLAHWVVGRFAIGYEHLDNSGDLPHPRTASTLLISGGAGFHLADFALDLALAGREPRGFSRYAPTLEQEDTELWLSLTLTAGF